MSAAAPAPWPADVPPPGIDPEAEADADAELRALEALYREEQRQRGIEPAPAPPATDWQPTNPVAAALWRALPASGQGVAYDRLIWGVAGDLGLPAMAVQVALLAIVLLGRAYCMPTPALGSSGGHMAGSSLVGRGTDPRLGAVAYRTGSLEGWA